MDNSVDIAHFSGSATILRADYDHLMNALKIYFTSGTAYEYVAVPHELFLEFQEAESAGKFFHTNIKGKFDFFKK